MMGSVADKQLLLVDADALPRRALAEQLEGLGYAVVEADSADAARAAIEDCDLLILGALADAARDAVCRAWRLEHSAVPLVLADSADIVARYQAEGAAVLARPVRLAELVRKLAEIAPLAATQTVAIGPLRFRPATRELGVAQPDQDKSDPARSDPVRLTEREAAILAYLHGQPGRAVPRDELLGRVFGYAGEVATHTLETHIYRLRRKLSAASESDSAPRLVSEDGGYRLVVSAISAR